MRAGALVSKRRIGAQKELQSRIGYRFRNADLLREALTHSTENPAGIDSNQSLAWLGDVVVNLVVSEALYRLLPDLARGAIDLRRQSIVNQKSLATAAKELNLDDYLVSSKGQPVPRDQLGSAAMERAFEAVVAAVYLDGGLSIAADFVRNTLALGLATSPRSTQA